MINQDKRLPMVGLFSLLTDKQKKMALEFSADHNFGKDEAFVIGRTIDVPYKK